MINSRLGVGRVGRHTFSLMAWITFPSRLNPAAKTLRGLDAIICSWLLLNREPTPRANSSTPSRLRREAGPRTPSEETPSDKISRVRLRPCMARLRNSTRRTYLRARPVKLPRPLGRYLARITEMLNAAFIFPPGNVTFLLARGKRV